MPVQHILPDEQRPPLCRIQAVRVPNRDEICQLLYEAGLISLSSLFTIQLQRSVIMENDYSLPSDRFGYNLTRLVTPRIVWEEENDEELLDAVFVNDCRLNHEEE